jgi:pimeloyl-ACP methyl ester carboxylesterase
MLSLLECMAYAHRAYNPSQPEEFTVNGASVFLYLHSPDCLVVSYRGTDPTSIDDWRANMDSEPIDVRGLGVMHRGLYEHFSRLEEYVVTKLNLRDIDICQVVVVGHSMGGSMALMLAALYPELVDSCVTFGAPKVCGTNWASIINHGQVPVTRVENDNDLIPRLPFGGGFVSAGKLLFLNSSGVRVSHTERSSLLESGLLDPFEDHSCNAYEAALRGEADAQMDRNYVRGVLVAGFIIGFCFIYLLH